MLFRRNTYEFLGGHAAVIGNIIEDVEFAALAKRHRVRLRVLRAESFGSARMYGGVGRHLARISEECFWLPDD